MLIENLPQLVQRIATRASANIDQDGDVGVERLADGIVEPSVRVQLLLVLLFQNEDDLDWRNAACDIALPILLY